MKTTILEEIITMQRVQAVYKTVQLWQMICLPLFSLIQEEQIGRQQVHIMVQRQRL